MSSELLANDLVKLQSENIDRYTRNFLHQAVCELRFPTLMSLGAAKPPADLVDRLRHDYPYLEQGNELNIGVGGAQASNPVHIFRSSKMNWSVTVKQSAIVIETTGYTAYAQMKKRILSAVAAAAGVIDSSFFTRVGLRYINTIDSNEDPADGWINPELVYPIGKGLFNGVSEFAGKIQMQAEDGGLTLQHGIGFRPGKIARPEYPDYTIDIDVFRNDVAVDSVEEFLDSMHTQAFAVFDWTIGDKARQYLIDGTRSAKK